jgi:protein-tyrosine phosphatase
MVMSPTFQIVHVCVANICRSPVAERLTRHGLDTRLGPAAGAFPVHSAGTRGLEGQPMHQHGAEALRGMGVDPEGFLARRLTPEILRPADLVLTATAAERDKVVAMLPAALRTTFTLLEFARLLAGSTLPPADADDPVERARVVVARARSMRGRVPYVDPALDDVADPVRTPAGFADCVAVVGPAVRTIVAALVGGSGLPEPRVPQPTAGKR